MREIAGTKEAGINRIVWDLRVAAPAGVPNTRGPFVLPGTYTVKLTAEGREMTRTLQVEADPALPVPDAERQARFTFLSTLNGMQATVYRATTAAADLARQASSLVKQVGKMPASPGGVVSAVESIEKSAREIQRRIAGGGDAEGEGGGFGDSLRARVNGLYRQASH